MSGTGSAPPQESEEPKARVFRYSTALYPVAERFQRFRQDVVHRFHWETLDLPSNGTEFELNFLLMPRMHLIHGPLVSPARLYCSERASRRGESDDFIFFCSQGLDRASAGNNGAHIDLARGSAILIDTTKPATIDWGAGQANTLKINRDALTASVERPDDLLNRPFDPQRPETQLLLQYIDIVASTADGMAASTLELADTHLLDLVACAAGPNRDFKAEAESRGLKAARLSSLMSYIRAHASNPALTVGNAANRHRLSERYVQMLLEETGRTFTETVREHRLLRAHRLLQDPHRRHRSITDIALECGFSSLSYFNRAFRQRFGDTPTGVRTSRKGP